MKDSVSNIWHKVVDGDTAAWAVLVRRFAPLVFKVARRAGLNQSDAEDCVQQTWLALYKSRRRIEDPRKLPGWLIRVVSRAASRLISRQTKQTITDGHVEPASSPPLQDQELIQLERLLQLETALSQLDERCERVLRAILTASPDLKYDDIARNLKMSPNSLGPTRNRCIKKLREILEDLG
jgi:RNA polymerase sigma factor (sigma-70 family)